MGRFPLILCVALLMPAYASGDINECNGVITNRPCEGGTPLMEEKPHQTPSQAEIEQQQRQFWINDLESAKFKVRRQYDLDIDVSLTAAICKTAPLEECRTAILEKERDINTLIAAKITANQSSSSASAPAAPASENIAVSIVQDQSAQYYFQHFGPHPRHPRRPPSHSNWYPGRRHNAKPPSPEDPTPVAAHR